MREKPLLTLACTVLGLACLALPATASGELVGAVSGTPGAYTFVGTAGGNDLRFEEFPGAGQLVFEEIDPSDEILSTSATCALQPGNVRVVCTYDPANPGTVQIGVGDGADLVVLADVATALGIAVGGGPGADRLLAGTGDQSLEGNEGNDLLEGGPGTDALLAGPGDDTVLAADGTFEIVNCGDGFDVASADRADVLISCESGRRDVDGDGSFPPADCNDADARVHPGASEVLGNGVDENCDSVDPPAEPAQLQARARAGWRVFARYTEVALLSVGPVPAGARVTVRCSGRGCPFRLRSRTISRNTRSVDFTRPFRRRKLRRGTTIRIRVTRPDSIGRLFRFRIRRGKLPDLDSLCLPPGTRRPRAC